MIFYLSIVMSWLNILYKPTSILGLLVAAGLSFLFIGGITISTHQQVSDFFLTWGKPLLLIGIAGWLLYIIPSLIRNWGKLF